MSTKYDDAIKYIETILSGNDEKIVEEGIGNFLSYIEYIGTTRTEKAFELLVEILKKSHWDFVFDWESPEVHEFALESLANFPSQQRNLAVQQFLQIASTWDSEDGISGYTSPDVFSRAIEIAIHIGITNMWEFLENIVHSTRIKYSSDFNPILLVARWLIRLDSMKAFELLVPWLYNSGTATSWFDFGLFQILADIGESIHPKLIKHLHMLIMKGWITTTDTFNALREIEEIPFSTELAPDDLVFPDHVEYGIQSIRRYDREAAANIVLQINSFAFYEIGESEAGNIDDVVNDILLVRALTSNRPFLIEAAGAFIAYSSRWYNYSPSTEVIQTLETVFSAKCGPAITCALSLSNSMESVDKLVKWLERRIKDHPNWPSPDQYIEKKVAISVVELIERLGEEAAEKVARGLYSKLNYRRVVAYLILGLFSTREQNHSILSAIGLGGFPEFFFGKNIDKFINEYTLVEFAVDFIIEDLEETPRKLAARGPLKKKWLSANHQ